MLLRLNRIEEFLLFLYAHRYHCHTRGHWTAQETGGLARGPGKEVGPYCTPAQQAVPLLVRWMLALEDSDAERLYLGKGLPSAWVMSGKKISIERAPTRWGRINFAVHVYRLQFPRGLTFYSQACRLPTAMRQKREGYQNRIELLQGTLDMLILQTLQWGPQHGYGISQSIRGRSGEVLQVETGSLYPALHRLEKQGWVTSQWKQTESNQRAKFYRLTPAGKKQLLSEQTRWAQIVAAVAGIMKPASEEGQP
jgi:transcriptional regulator